MAFVSSSTLPFLWPLALRQFK